MKRVLLLATCLIAIPPIVSVPAGAAGADPMTTVSRVDLNRYAGLWYEISRMPNRFQRDCSGNVTAEYRLREDGRIDVVNRCATRDGEAKQANGVARIVDEASRAKLKVRFAPAFLSFLPMVWGDYWILDIAPDYGYAVVGEPSRRYLWVLARTPALDESTYRGILERIKAQGYNPSELVRTLQDRPEPTGTERGDEPPPRIRSP